jgi:hypothetical protein
MLELLFSHTQHGQIKEGQVTAVRKRHAMEAHVCLFMIHSTTLLLAQKIGR